MFCENVNNFCSSSTDCMTPEASPPNTMWVWSVTMGISRANGNTVKLQDDTQYKWFHLSLEINPKLLYTVGPQ